MDPTKTPPTTPNDKPADGEDTKPDTTSPDLSAADTGMPSENSTSNGADAWKPAEPTEGEGEQSGTPQVAVTQNGELSDNTPSTPAGNDMPGLADEGMNTTSPADTTSVTPSSTPQASDSGLGNPYDRTQTVGSWRADATPDTMSQTTSTPTPDGSEPEHPTMAALPPKAGTNKMLIVVFVVILIGAAIAAWFFTK